MDIRYARSAAVFFVTQSQSLSLSKRYANYLNEMRAVLTENQTIATEQSRTDLFSALNEFGLDSRPAPEKDFLALLSASEFVGMKAITDIEEALASSAHDPGGAFQRIEAIQAGFNTTMSISAEVVQTLNKVPLPEISEIADGMGLLSFRLQDKVEAESIEQLKKRAELLEEILYGIGRPLKDPAQAAKLVYLDKTNPVDAAIVANLEFLKLFGTTLAALLTPIVMIAKMRKWKSEAANLPVPQKTREQLDRDDDEALKNAIDQCHEKGLEALEGMGVKVEKEDIAHFKSGIRKLLDLLVRGGKIDSSLPPPCEEEEVVDGELSTADKVRELELIYEEVRQLDLEIEEQGLLPDLSAGYEDDDTND
jgi:hypothetical protein